MISIRGLSVRYPDATRAVLRGVDLDIEDGEMVLVTGRTGTGKSTLLGSINNLVPRFTGGRRSGTIHLDGVDITELPPRELADRIGWVGQDPLAGFVTDTVEEELAYAMEQLGRDERHMRTRVEETLDLLGIAELRRRALRTLSGGQQQRVAIASVLTAGPRVLILDEPTSALDPVAAEDVMALLHRLVHDLGTTVVLAEHRMERVIEYADSAVRVLEDGRVEHGPVRAVMTRAAAEPHGLVPPLVELGTRLGWEPLPLDIRDARRQAATLRRDLSPPPAPPPTPRTPPSASRGRGGIDARGVVVRYGRTIAVRDVSCAVAPGEVAALLGRNGSGKSSLLWALHGAGVRQAGHVELGGRGAALVPQTPADLLYLDSVDQECTEADTQLGVPEGETWATVNRLVPGIDGSTHPRDLSEGQKLALVLAVQLGARVSAVLLDEPTRGLDYPAKAELTTIIHELAADGAAVIIATHDVEFVAQTCGRALVMAQGEIVADATVREVLAGSPLLSTQVAKIMSPLPFLTVAELVAGVAAGVRA